MTFPRVKYLLIRAMTHRSVGAVIAQLTNNKIRQFKCVYDTHFKEVKTQIKAALFWGFYEKPEASFIYKYLSGNCPVIELGGSLGIISCVAGKRLKNKKLIIVEANKSLLPVIEANLKLNGISDTTLEWGGLALGDQLYFVEGRMSYNGKVTAQYEPGCVEIPKIDMNDLLLKNTIGYFSLISDIEGAENIFLFESPSCLTHCREMIIELHPTLFKGKLLSLNEQKAQIERLGFRIIEAQDTVVYAKRGD